MADEAVPFTLAAAWAGLGGGRAKGYCPFGLGHDDGGAEPAFRVYDDHGYCFAEQRYFTVTSLLAGVWEADPEDAAAEALRRVGYKPAGYAHLWEQASLAVAPDKDALAAALKTWCAAHCADWETRQYSEAVAVRLARCLGLLHLVKDAPDCERWLEGCKRAMQPYLVLTQSLGYTALIGTRPYGRLSDVEAVRDPQGTSRAARLADVRRGGLGAGNLG